MSDSRNLDLGAIRETSYGRAVEQAVHFAANGLTPIAAIRSVNMTWRNDTPTWDDAIYVLAYAWRRRCSAMPGAAFDIHHPEKKPTPRKATGPALRAADTQRIDARRLITCMQPDCGNEFVSTGPENRHCPACRKRIDRLERALG